MTGEKIQPGLGTKKLILAAIETNYSQDAGQLAAHKDAHEYEKKVHKHKVAAQHKTEPVVREDNVAQMPVPPPSQIEAIAAELPIVTIAEDRVLDQGGFMLDFTKSVKQHFPVIMIDNQTIRVRTPTKPVFAALIELQDKFTKLVTLNANISAQLDEIYGLSATILSNNLEQKEISSEYLSNLLDLEDLRIFYKAYMDFVKSVLNDA